MKSLKEYLVPTITLFVICLVATALLGLTNQVTAPIIEQLAIETEIKSRQVVFADATSFGEAEILADGTSVVAALDESGNTIGHVVVNSAKGYGGEIKVMTGIDVDGKITAVKILSAADTTLDDTAGGKGKSYDNFQNGIDVSTVKVIGTTWIWGLTKQKDGKWADGYIIDPENGSRYKCKITFHKADGHNHWETRLPEYRGFCF